MISETTPSTAFIMASIIGGGFSPPPMRVTVIDTPDCGREESRRVRRLFFCRRARSFSAHSRQTYSSSSTPSFTVDTAVSASFFLHNSHFISVYYITNGS